MQQDSTKLKSSKFLAYFRLALIMLILVLLVSLSVVLRIILFFLPRHYFLRFNVRFIIYPFSRLLMRIIGVGLTVKGEIAKSNLLIVSNHQGIIDSLLHMALAPCLVISNTDVQRLKIIGKVMGLLGFVFVDRSRRKSIQELLAPTITMITKSHVNLSFFPEGKSNYGVEMHPFKASFFKIAVDSNSGVQPLAFRWTHANGNKLSKEQLQFFTFFVTDGYVVKHLISILGLRRKKLSVRVLREITPEEISKNNWNRKDLSQQSERSIRAAMLENDW
jgi:1-acyl-sn-glycerol-3-phosphate acyltransferase